MVLRCVYGKCNSDTRYPERLNGMKIFPFPKPKTQYDRCVRWIQACGRPQAQLNVNKIDRNKGVCTKHFVEAIGPTELHPDPIPWTESESSKDRPPPKKKRKEKLAEQDLQQTEVTTYQNVDASSQTEEMWTPAWDMFTLSAESQRMKEELNTKDSQIARLFKELQQKKDEIRKFSQKCRLQEAKIKHLEEHIQWQNLSNAAP